MKLFNKIAIAALGAAMAIGIGTGIANSSSHATKAAGESTTYTMTIDSSNSGNNDVHWTGSSTASLTYDSVTWSTSVVGTSSFTNSKTYAQVGSKNNPATKVELSTTAFAGKVIESVSFTGYCMSNDGPRLTVTAGSTKMIDSVALVKTTSTKHTSNCDPVTLGASDAVTFTVNSSAKAAICISAISVTYSEASSGEDDPTLDSVTITGDFTKKSYIAGEPLDFAGLSLVGNYSDGSDEILGTVTELRNAKYLEFLINDSEDAIATSGMTQVVIDYVMYEKDEVSAFGSEDAYTYTGFSILTVDSVEIVGDMTKKSYAVDEDWDFTGLSVQVNYTNSTNAVLGTVNDFIESEELEFDLDHACAENGVTSLTLSDIWFAYGNVDVYEVADFTITGITVSNQSYSGKVAEGQYYIKHVKNGTTYYLQSKGSSSSPVPVTTVSDATLFTFTLVANDTYTIKDGANYLYSTNANNGLRVGDTEDSWVITTGSCNTGAYDIKDTSYNRYLCLYNTQDFRTYTDAAATNRTENTDLEAPGRTLSSIVATGTPTKTTYEAGESFNPTGLTVTATYSDGGTEDVTLGVTWTPSPLTVGTTSVTGTYSTETVTINGITVNEPVVEDKYTLVTSTSELKAGDKIIIAASSANYALGAAASDTATNRAGKAITKNGEVLNSIGDATELSLIKVGSSWAFYDADKDGFLYAASSSANQLKTKSSIDDSSSWTIAINNGVTSVTANDSDVRGVMQYNPNGSNPIFSCYATATQSAICLYRYEGEVVAATSVVMSKATASVEEGKTTKLSASIEPANASDQTIVWSTSDNTVATVDGGVVTGVKAGTATITATLSGTSLSSTATVTVTEFVDTLTSISVGGDYKTEFNVNDTFEFGGTVTATYESGATKDVTDEAQFAGYDMSTGGSQTVTVSFGGKTTTYGITVKSGSTGGDTKTITITRASFETVKTTYAWYEWEQDGISGEAFIYNNNSYLQFNGGKDGRTIFNTDAIPGKITNIAMTASTTGTARSWALYVNSSAFAENSGTSAGTKVGSDQTVSFNGVSWDVTGNNSYFMLYLNEKSASNITEIVITYVESGSTQPTAASVAAEIRTMANGWNNNVSTASCNANYKAAKALVVALSEGELTIFQTSDDTDIQSARVTYLHWCAVNGDNSPYSGEAVTSNKLGEKVTSNSTSMAMLVVIFGMMSTLTAAGFVFYKKRKAN